jgi:hypothetical protein
MPPFEIDYTVGKYRSTIIVQAVDEYHAEVAVWAQELLPENARILSIRRRQVS